MKKKAKYARVGKRRQKARLFLLLLSILSVSALSISVSAEEAPNTAPEVVFSVTVTAVGEKPSLPEVYTVRLTALDEPDSSASESRSLALFGPGTASFPPIVYDRVGVYRYELSQLAGECPEGLYDKSVYTAKVTVTDPEDGSGLNTAVTLWKDGLKRGETEFVNSYLPSPVHGDRGDPTPDTPVDPPSEEPVEGPADEPPAQPREPAPTQKGERYPERLIQTGQLRWPGWVLGFAGGMCLLFGWLRMIESRRKEKKR